MMDETLIRKALDESEEALDILRRGFGAEVSGLCYPALNTVRRANDHLRELAE